LWHGWSESFFIIKYVRRWGKRTADVAKEPCKQTTRSVCTSHGTHKHKQKSNFFVPPMPKRLNARSASDPISLSLSLSPPGIWLLPWITRKLLSLIPTSGLIALRPRRSDLTKFKGPQHSSFFASAAGVRLRFRSALKSPKVFHFKGFIVVAFLFCSFTYFSVCLRFRLLMQFCEQRIWWGGWYHGIFFFLISKRIRYVCLPFAPTILSLFLKDIGDKADTFSLLFLTIICKDLCMMLDDEKNYSFSSL